MPKLGMPQNEFIQEIQKLVAQKCCNLWPDDITEIAKSTNQVVINSGAECVVVPEKDCDQEVIAYTYFDLNPLRAKELFYSQKIYSTLFPNNFPRFYSASGGSLTYRNLPSGTIRQKIESRKEIKIIYSFQEVVDVCTEIGLPLLVELGGDNTTVGKDGGEYYLDTTQQLHPAYIDQEKLFTYMRQRYTAEDIRVVKSSIARLTEIHRQAEIQRKNRKLKNK